MGIFENFITTIVVLVLVSHQSLESSPLSLTTDKEALVSFKSQINNPSVLPTWDQNLSPCNWSGVSCDRLGRRVVGIYLSGLRMTGPISPHIGNLSFLGSLELQNNQLTGELPHQLGNLVRLRSLNVSFNGIGGVIPSNISRCEDLRTLDVTNNMISGKIPREISYLTQLQVLNMASNRLSGNLSPFLSNLSSLTNLNLGTNNLGGPIPNEFSQFMNLKYLDLTINNLSGIVPPSIYNMSSLVYLALASNELAGELPENIGFTLPNLLGFNFCFNRFTGTIPLSLHNLTNIQIIRIAHNLLHGSIPPGLGNLINLEMYNIGFNNIVGDLNFLEHMTNSTRLNFLAFDFNLFEGVIPWSIGNLSKELSKLYMGGNDIHGTIPSSIGELRALELLNMSYSSISGEIPSEIGELRELRVLGLAGNNISGKIPVSLGDLRFLTKIDMSKNNLVGNIPKSLGNIQSLSSIDLSDNMLNGSIPTEIVNIPGLSAFLNLSQNHLTGSLPLEIGSLEKVAVINISDNMLSGNIPMSIGECKSLEQLSLARNMLSGPLPDTLESIRGLEILDLSSNQLSGSIPFDLQNLQSLQLLNLSFNYLEGEIPTDGVFADPFKVHLESNQNLYVCCKNPRKSEKKLTSVYIIVTIVVAISLCFAIGLIYFVRRGKGRVNSSIESLRAQPQMVSYEELRVATDNFNEENLIGRGGFGSVYKGIIQGVAVAVKVLDTATANSRKTFLAECAALRLLRHRNLIKLTTVCSSINSKNEEFLALIFEFMSNGSLDDWISGKRSQANGVALDFCDRLRFAVGIASAIDYLHNETEVPVVHCDLKPSNVFLDSDMTPKVGDLGLAKLLLDTDSKMSLSSTHALRGSIGYIPSEYGYGEKPSTAGDVYSFGILLLELFTGRSPTHETFFGGLSLTSWVQMHFPTDIDQVLEFDLLQEMNNYFDEGKSSRTQNHCDCLITVLGVGLSCAAESPDARIAIRDALHKLKDVEKKLQKYHELVVDHVEERGLHIRHASSV
ncbi:hypothetical protein CASFOL_036229 [Castilleja foliolosa]|uniref:non-specific serine/threonine protein kinase n=1 Tax=Castilleja foliolosa TaxID=1961234 RepID=A0ABD3BXF4_9LAMI